jgi:hypothetical protein
MTWVLIGKFLKRSFQWDSNVYDLGHCKENNTFSKIVHAVSAVVLATRPRWLLKPQANYSMFLQFQILDWLLTMLDISAQAKSKEIEIIKGQ